MDKLNGKIIWKRRKILKLKKKKTENKENENKKKEKEELNTWKWG